MYTRKGDDQQASYRLCNLNPLHPILCALFIFIHIIDCGYSVESFNDAHEKNVILQVIKRLMLNFLGQLSTGRNTERGGYFCQCTRLRLNSIDLKILCTRFYLNIQNTGFLSRGDFMHVFIV